MQFIDIPIFEGDFLAPPPPPSKHTVGNILSPTDRKKQ